jgi:hypothetical protein
MWAGPAQLEVGGWVWGLDRQDPSLTLGPVQTCRL